MPPIVGRYDRNVAKEIIARIYHADILYQQYNQTEKPVVFMSKDLLSILAAELPDSTRIFDHAVDVEVCGHKVKIAMGTDVLYVGFEI